MVSVTEKKTYAIWIGSLPEDVKESDVFQKFKSYGPICSVKISRHKNGVSRGFGFVNYYDESDAKRAAKEADGNSMFGAEEIKVCFKDGHHTEKDLRPYTDCLHFMKDEKCSKKEDISSCKICQEIELQFRFLVPGSSFGRFVH
eukprot:gene17952-19747_t